MKVDDLQKQIRILRDNQGISLRKLGEMCGVPHTSISMIERGLKYPMIDTLYKIFDALGYELAIVVKA